MVRVEADFQERRRVVFTARGRSWVNVKEARDDGPIGFTSGELLLMALANCTLGTLLGHQLLKDVPVRACRAVLESEGERNPTRLGDIRVTIELDVGEEDLAAHQPTLERVASTCTIGNTLRLSPRVQVEVRLTGAAQGASAGAP